MSCWQTLGNVRPRLRPSSRVPSPPSSLFDRPRHHLVLDRRKREPVRAPQVSSVCRARRGKAGRCHASAWLWTLPQCAGTTANHHSVLGDHHALDRISPGNPGLGRAAVIGQRWSVRTSWLGKRSRQPPHHRFPHLGHHLLHECY